MIRNVDVINFKVGLMLNTSWYAAIEDCNTYTLWYGIVTICSNFASITNVSLSGTVQQDAESYVPLIPHEPEGDLLPAFIYQDQPYLDFGLNDNVKFAKTGLYNFSTSLSLIGVAIEHFTIALTNLNSSITVTNFYAELNIYYSIASGLTIIYPFVRTGGKANLIGLI